jgi:hypothetical protein
MRKLFIRLTSKAPIFTLATGISTVYLRVSAEEYIEVCLGSSTKMVHADAGVNTFDYWADIEHIYDKDGNPVSTFSKVYDDVIGIDNVILESITAIPNTSIDFEITAIGVTETIDEGYEDAPRFPQACTQYIIPLATKDSANNSTLIQYIFTNTVLEDL